MRLLRRRPKTRSIRAESFGAIAQLERPRALVFVDRDYARELGIEASPHWRHDESDGVVGRECLVAPLEAHLQLTNRCDAGCTGCYTAASPSASKEWSLEQWKAAIDELAEMGVFHLALGGGESADLPWLGALVRHARERGGDEELPTRQDGGSRVSVFSVAHVSGPRRVDAGRDRRRRTSSPNR